MDRLLPSALAPSTCNSYRCAWSKFTSFAKRFKLSLIFPIPVKHLSCFICFLFNEGMAVSSINTILSALTHGILTSFRFGGLPGGGVILTPLPIFCLWTDFDGFFS